MYSSTMFAGKPKPRRFQWLRLLLCAPLLDGLWLTSKHRRGIHPLECRSPRFRWPHANLGQEDYGEEADAWCSYVDFEHGHLRSRAWHFHDHSPLPVPLRSQ